MTTEEKRTYRRRYYQAHAAQERAATRRYARAHPAATRALDRQRQARKQQILAAAKNKPCLDCKGVFPSCVMDFDHVRGIKHNNVSRMVRGHSLASLHAEIAKCDVVCANCHRLRTQQRSKPKDGRA